MPVSVPLNHDDNDFLPTTPGGPANPNRDHPFHNFSNIDR